MRRGWKRMNPDAQKAVQARCLSYRNAPVFTFYIFYISVIGGHKIGARFTAGPDGTNQIYTNETLWRLKWFVCDFVYIVVQSED